MDWNTSGVGQSAIWSNITNLEAKRRVAHEMAERLRDGDVVGVGSGSTSYLALHALADRAREYGWHFTAITASVEMELECQALDVTTTSLLRSRPAWSFDGADEIDEARNMIKGRGGAMVREKLIMASSPERYVVIDRSKKVDRLGHEAAVPLEIIPESFNLVRSELESSFSVQAVALRLSDAKDGPVVTERANFIMDVKFADVNAELDARLNALPGVVGSGLFFGFNPTIVSD